MAPEMSQGHGLQAGRHPSPWGLLAGQPPPATAPSPRCPVHTKLFTHLTTVRSVGYDDFTDGTTKASRPGTRPPQGVHPPP